MSFESIELLRDTSCASPYEMNSIAKSLPLILSSNSSSLRWQTYFSASELKKSGLRTNADVYGVRARLWKRLEISSDCTIRFGMAQVAGELEDFQEFVNVRQMGKMSRVSVGDKERVRIFFIQNSHSHLFNKVEIHSTYMYT